jgi:hypothetical protein
MLMRTSMRLFILLTILAATAMVARAQQLDERCVVSILNRTARVSSSGAWVIPNVPANLGRVRARATCTVDGQTVVGQSDYFSVPANGLVDAVPITFAAPVPVPAKLTLSAPQLFLSAAAETLQFSTTLHMPGGEQIDATAALSGTSYTTSNAAVLTVSPDGLATAVGSGLAIVSAINEGSLGLLRITVGASVDTDTDGLPDSWELANGLNPNDSADAGLDADGDGLNNLREYEAGTDRTNADTDGDGVRDGLEVLTESDPLNRNSYRLDRALRHIAVSPPAALLRTNPLFGESTQQLRVTGTLLDSTTIDITSATRGTNFTSNDLTICNFGDIDGRLFAGNDGTTTLTVNSNGFTALVPVEVAGFTPQGLSSIAIPGYANNVKVSNGYAFVAAGSGGLQVVNVSNPSSPSIAAALALAGNANDLRLRDGLAYIAAGAAGLAIVDVHTPAAPSLLSTLATGGEIQDLWIDGDYAYLADATGALKIAFIGASTSPVLMGSLSLSHPARGVAVYAQNAVVATDQGISIVNVANVSSPTLAGFVDLDGEPKDVLVETTLAYVAAYTGGLQIVDFSNPATPFVVGSLPSVFVPRDVALLGQFAMFAEQLFPNAIPFVDISDPANPAFRDIIDLSSLGDYAETGIDLDMRYVYVTAEQYVVGNDTGVTGDTRLLIAQYNDVDDLGGIHPTVSIMTPTAGDALIAGTTAVVALDAVDDIGVASAKVLIDGRFEAGTVRQPFNLTIRVPENVSSITLGATATDYGNNTAQAANVIVSVIPDPLTIVTGTVKTGTGIVVAGVSVTLNEWTTTTDGTGHYAFTSVPTIDGTLLVSASGEFGGEFQYGVSQPTEPVPGGVTLIDVTIDPPPDGKVSSTFIPGFGNALEAVGTTLYVAAGDSGLHVIDAYDPLSPQIVGSLQFSDGPAFDVEVAGDIAYVSTGPVQVVNIADRDAPQLLATVATVDVRTLTLHGNYLLAGGPDGLVTIDVSDPTAPLVLGTRPFDDEVRTISVRGDLAVVAEVAQFDNSSGTYTTAVNIVDVSTMAAPSVIGRIVVPGRVRDSLIRGSRVYLAMSGPDVQIVDFSTPATPELLTPYNGYIETLALASRGDYLVLAGQEPYFNDALQMVDLSTEPPARLEDLHIPHSWYARDVALSGRFAYAIVTENVWEDYNNFSSTELLIARYPATTDPGNVAPTVTITSPQNGQQVVEGGTVMVEVTATDDQGVEQITLTAAGRTVQTSSQVPLRIPLRISGGGATFEVGASATDFGNRVGTAASITLNVQPDPLTTITGLVRLPGGLPAVNAIVSTGNGLLTTTDVNGVYSFENASTIRGNYVVIARKVINGEDLRAVSVSIAPVIAGTTVVPDLTLLPLTPGPVTTLIIPGYANGVDRRGRLAAVAAGAAGVHFVDFTDLETPEILSSLPLEIGSAWSIRMSGTRVYAGSEQGLEIIDSTDPAQPQMLGEIQLNAPAQGLDVVGTNVYIANKDDGFTVVDAHNPAAPVIVGSLPLPGDSRSVAVSASIAVVVSRGYDYSGYGDFRSDVHIIDIREPQVPVLLAKTDVPGDATDVALRGSIAYIAANDGGVSALDLSTPSAPVDLDESTNDVIASAIAVRGPRVVSAGTLDDTRSVLDVFDIANSELDPEERVDFSIGRVYKPTDLALAGDIALVTAQRGGSENEFGSSGNTKLFFAKYTAAGDGAGIAPTIAFASPANNATLIGGSQVLVQLNVSDDIGLDIVKLTVDGNEIVRFSGPPYQIVFTVPMNATTLTFGASATDLGENTATATNVVVSVIPDPGTIVTGIVRNLSGNPVQNASVLVRGTLVQSDANGRYTANGIATIGGDLVIEAWTTVSNEFVSGKSSPTEPLPAQTTNIADITLQPLPIGAVANLAMPGFANAVSAHGTLAAVAAGNAGLVLVDLSVPTHPAIVGQLAVTGSAADVKLTEDLAYVASLDGGLTIVDVTDPAQPEQLGYIATEGEALDLAVAGTTVYVADGVHGLKVYDVTDPETPLLIDSSTVTTYAKAVDVFGSYAVVIDRGHPWNGNALVSIVDVSNLLQPQVVATTTLSSGLTDVAIRNTHAFISGLWGWTYTVDFTTPQSTYSTNYYNDYWSSTIADSGSALLQTGFQSAVPGILVRVLDATDPLYPFDASIVDFSAAGNYTGTDAEPVRELLVMTAGQSGFDEINAEGESRLFIGKYRELVNGQAKVNPKQ